MADKISIKFNLNFSDFGQHLWESISAHIPGKDWYNCKEKVLSLIPVNLSEVPWTETEH